MPYREPTKRKDRGLCCDCPNPIVPGKARCAKHLYSRAGRERRRYDDIEVRERKHVMVKARTQLFRIAGRCARCGCPLTEDEEGYCVVCKIERCRPKIGNHTIGTYKGE